MKTRLLLAEPTDLVRDPGNRWHCELMPGADVVLGRQRQADLLLPHARVCRRHARIWETEGHWYVQALRMRSVFLLNGASVRDFEAHEVCAGDLLLFGDTHLKVELIAFEDPDS
jgi:FHA domain-containing protein